MSRDARHALLVSDSNIARDPRVLRQLNWLRDAGWEVDTLGRGPAPEGAGNHVDVPRPPLVRRVLGYLLPVAAAYRAVLTNHIPETRLDDLSGSGYDLVVLNEIEFLPWFDRRHGRLLAPGGRVHLDLHEFSPGQRSGVVFAVFFKRLRTWMESFVTASWISTRTTVSTGIAGRWIAHTGVADWAIVRSTPGFVDQEPSPVDPADVRLLYHGGASLDRSLELLIGAVALLDERYTLHLMLVGAPRVIADLRARAASLGDRVRFREPVAMSAVAAEINDCDLEVVFYPPTSDNLRYALPNKVFEAIQGRLGIVVGESPSMAELVREHGNGIVVDGWTAADLARTLNATTPDQVAAAKRGSHAAARELSAEREGSRFLAAIG